MVLESESPLSGPEQILCQMEPASLCGGDMLSFFLLI